MMWHIIIFWLIGWFMIICYLMMMVCWRRMNRSIIMMVIYMRVMMFYGVVVDWRLVYRLMSWILGRCG